MGEARGKEAKDSEEVAKEEMEVGRLEKVGEAALPCPFPLILEKLIYLNQFKKCLKTIAQLIIWQATYLSLAYSQRIFTLLAP